MRRLPGERFISTLLEEMMWAHSLYGFNEQMKIKEASRAAQFYQQAADALQKVNPVGGWRILLVGGVGTCR